MDWRFPAVLVLALVLSMVMSGVQMRAYMAQVNEIAKANAGKNLNLVSGRGKGAFRGAIAVLLVDPTTLEVVEARAQVTLPPAKSKKRGQPTAVKGAAPKQFAGLSRISN